MGKDDKKEDKEDKDGEDRKKNRTAKSGTAKSKLSSQDGLIITLLIIVAVITVFNQFQISSINSMTVKDSATQTSSDFGEKDLSNIDISSLKSTGHTIAAVLPLKEAESKEEVMNIMIPRGTPEYGEALGVSFEKPVESLSKLAKMYRPLKSKIKKEDPEAFQRFMDLASKPVGISCEFCCGLRAVGIDENGNSVCGCQHNPALLSVALHLTANTDYSQGEVLREVVKWKTIFFPKDMIKLGMKVSGKGASEISNLPGMVGGC